MALETGRTIFANAGEELLKALDASEANLTNLELELENYREQKDWGNVAVAAEKLRQLSEFRSDILGIDNPFEAVLEKYIEKGLISPPPTRESAPSKEHRRGTRKPDKYIDDASAILGLALIQKRPGDLFEYKSLRDIGKCILQEDRKDNRGAIGDARLYVYQEALYTSKGILAQAMRLKTNTMNELLAKSLPPNIPNKLWKEFYTKVREGYGQMAPKDFVTKVLLRFHPQENVKNLTKDIIDEVREYKKRQPTKFGPGDMSPLEELVLCSRIADKTTYTNLTQVFNGQTPLNIAIAHGFPCPSSNFSDCLMESREEMAKLRGNKQIDAREGAEATRKIQRAINIMSKDRRGWHKLNPEYHALQFIYSLVAEVEHDPTKVQGIIDALFPEKTYTVDAKDSFLLMPGIGGNDK
jgi:hypothetical protein